MSLPDIHFAEKDPAVIKAEMVAILQEQSGRNIAPADPLMIIADVLTAQFVTIRNQLDFTGRMNLLLTSQGSYLDEKVKDFKLERNKAIPAYVTICFTLVAPQAKNVIVKKDTKVSAGDNVYFAVPNDVVIKAGDTSADIICYCTEGGEIGNDYLPGEINTQFNPQQFIGGVVNTDISAGGVDVEDDESLISRRLSAPDALSVAGPDGAYIHWAKLASAETIDAKVDSPNPGEVVIYILMTDGRMPTNTELQLTLAMCNSDDRRPLTDKVIAKAPEQVPYDIDLRYWISNKTPLDPDQMKANINQAVQNFIYNIKTNLGEAINPDVLRNMVMNAGARRIELSSPIQLELKQYQIGQNINCNVEFVDIEVDN